MDRKFINYLFFFISFFLIFNNIPKPIQANFIGGILQSKLVFYPIFVGMLYTLYCQYKYKNVLVHFDKFLKFVLIYAAITLISLLVGLFNYPYYDLVVDGPVTQIEKLPRVLEILKGFGIDADVKLLTAFWMIARTIKGLLFEIIYAFGGAYMIYCWYHDDWQTAFKILVKGVLASLVVVFGYSVIEVFYLAGNETAKNILEVITPYFHIIKSEGTWWPPLLWKAQLRSVFAEPSYYGIYFAAAMPLLWYAAFKADKLIYKILLHCTVAVFTFGLFLTQARTAVALFAGELFIFVFILVYLRNKFMFKKAVGIFACTVLAFAGANYYITNMLADNRYKITNAEDYLESNLTSLASTQKRSNNSRYSIMTADFKIGLDYPLLGVGMGLRNAYIPEYLPEMAKNNGEVKRWLKDQKEKGIMRSGFPKLGEYTSRFAETGALGLTAFLLPPLFLMKKLYSKLACNKKDITEKLPYVFFTIAFIGSMAAGIGDSINITYCYWVLLGLGYAMCFGKSNAKENESKINHE